MAKNRNVASYRSAGFTLMEVLVAVAIVGILVAFAYPMYQESVKKGRLSDVQKALLDNAQAWERHYASHGNFRKTSRLWIDLPIRETDFFCIRPQGAPRGATHDGQFAFKAVALNKQQEPRALILNQDLTMLLCESTTSACSETDFFANPSRADKNCRAYP
ncbi:type IV pilin protein [Kingella kingae]|uniref:Pilin n=2 Tax=Kingella kingae TaxID=504 RepID=F5S556_KINKI|nr:type IV pilin protein [Kingella kingae]EGK11481.1 hypothetical protein HMPREF0476_0339 [Kingella kingae ATCC 23330]MDK4530230.1 type IV pilin protein [Kingella kingae]MDK4535327.1 type IV pilin protein [Kingella kingae]MDK4541843.1 type IV pilin protein [Kingella kingae]MDK4553152.1 type IV pilin protein [Kingella kingae]